MSTSGAFCVHFVLREKINQPGYGSVFMRIIHQMKRVEISMKVVVQSIEWDNSKGRLSEKLPEYKDINMFLDQSKAKMWAHYKNARIYGDGIDLYTLKDIFQGIEVKEKTIIEAFVYHYKMQSAVLKPGTMKNYRTTEKYIREFVTREKRKTDIPLSKINFQFITEFEYFLRAYIPITHRKRM